MSDIRPTTYWDYIQVDKLLDLQGGLPDKGEDPDNHEVLFITVHQVFELWFQLILRELGSARDLFGGERVEEQELSGVASSLKRVTTIFQVAADHFRVVETLPTRAYLAFRKKLTPASGGQSAQMRQIEILFGLEESERVSLGSSDGHMEILREPDGSMSSAYKRVTEQLNDPPTLKAAIEGWLLRTPINGVPSESPSATEALNCFVSDYSAAHRAEVDASCEHAQAIAKGAEAKEAIGKRYEWERDAAQRFLHSDDTPEGQTRMRVRAAMLFIETYRDLPLLAWPREVLGNLLELEQSFLIFRQRHAE